MSRSGLMRTSRDDAQGLEGVTLPAKHARTLKAGLESGKFLVSRHFRHEDSDGLATLSWWARGIWPS